MFIILFPLNGIMSHPHSDLPDEDLTGYRVYDRPKSTPVEEDLPPSEPEEKSPNKSHDYDEELQGDASEELKQVGEPVEDYREYMEDAEREYQATIAEAEASIKEGERVSGDSWRRFFPSADARNKYREQLGAFRDQLSQYIQGFDDFRANMKMQLEGRRTQINQASGKKTKKTKTKVKETEAPQLPERYSGEREFGVNVMAYTPVGYHEDDAWDQYGASVPVLSLGALNDPKSYGIGEDIPPIPVDPLIVSDHYFPIHESRFADFDPAEFMAMPQPVVENYDWLTKREETLSQEQGRASTAAHAPLEPGEKPIDRLIPLAASAAIGTELGLIRSATFIVRPKQWVQSTAGIRDLITKPEARQQLAQYMHDSPEGMLGGILGGWAAGALFESGLNLINPSRVVPRLTADQKAEMLRHQRRVDTAARRVSGYRDEDFLPFELELGLNYPSETMPLEITGKTLFKSSDVAFAKKDLAGRVYHLDDFGFIDDAGPTTMGYTSGTPPKGNKAVLWGATEDGDLSLIGAVDFDKPRWWETAAKLNLGDDLDDAAGVGLLDTLGVETIGDDAVMIKVSDHRGGMPALKQPAAELPLRNDPLGLTSIEGAKSFSYSKLLQTGGDVSGVQILSLRGGMVGGGSVPGISLPKSILASRSGSLRLTGTDLGLFSFGLTRIRAGSLTRAGNLTRNSITDLDLVSTSQGNDQGELQENIPIFDFTQNVDTSQIPRIDTPQIPWVDTPETQIPRLDTPQTQIPWVDTPIIFDDFFEVPPITPGGDVPPPPPSTPPDPENPRTPPIFDWDFTGQRQVRQAREGLSLYEHRIDPIATPKNIGGGGVFDLGLVRSRGASVLGGKKRPARRQTHAKDEGFDLGLVTRRDSGKSGSKELPTTSDILSVGSAGKRGTFDLGLVSKGSGILGGKPGKLTAADIFAVKPEPGRKKASKKRGLGLW